MIIEHIHIIYAIVAVAAIAEIFIGTRVFLQLPRSMPHRVFAAFSYTAALWTLSVLVIHIYPSMFWSDAALLFGILCTYSFFSLAAVYPNQKTTLRYLFIMGTPILMLIPLILAGYIIMGIRITADGIPAQINGPLLPLYLATAALYILMGLRMLIITYAQARGLAKIRLQYLFLGAGTFSLIALVADAALPAIGISGYQLMGPAATVIFVGSIGYAIARHQLLDVRLILQRGIVFSWTLALIIVTYISILFAVEPLIHNEASAPLAGFITVVLGILGAPKIENIFRQFTDPLFFKGIYDHAKAVQTINNLHTNLVDRQQLILRTATFFRHIFKTQYIAFHLADGTCTAFLNEKKNTSSHPLPKQTRQYFVQRPYILIREERGVPRPIEELFTQHNAAHVCIPLIAHREFFGLVFLGGKQSEEAYVSRDIELLEIYSRHAATALERSALYEEAIRHSEELEERVCERTEELQNIQEAQKQTMIDIAHNLQTPLTILRNNLSTLQHGSYKGKELAPLERNIDDISKFIYDLLSLARLEQRAEVRLSPINMSTTLLDMIEYFDVLAKDKSITLTHQIESDIIVDGNKKMIEELMANLVSNAMKYMKDNNERSIHIGLKQEGARAILTIRDNGSGIPQDMLPNIFDRFYRAHEEKQNPGSGLGLAIVKQIVEKHHGHIEVESEVDKGTTFTISFPTQ